MPERQLNLNESKHTYCSQCRRPVAAGAKFCQFCGTSVVRTGEPATLDAVANPPQSEERASPEASLDAPTIYTFRKTRAANWAVVGLVGAGTIFMLLKVSKSPTALLGSGLFMAAVLSVPFITAIVLSQEVAIFLGSAIYIGPERKRSLQKAMLWANSILLVLGVAGLLACIATGQVGPMLSMLIYVLLPLANIRALRVVLRS